MKKEPVKILASTGPRLNEVHDFIQSIEIGVDIFRIHLGKKSRDHIRYIKNIRLAEDKLNRKVKIFVDLPSTRPRVGKINLTYLHKGQTIQIIDSNNYENSIDNQSNCIPISNFQEYFQYIKFNDRVLFRDGNVVMKVYDKESKYGRAWLKCEKALLPISESSSCLFPDSLVKFRVISNEEIKFFKSLKEFNLEPDGVIISFVSGKNEIQYIKSVLYNVFGDNKIQLISKIETKEGVQNIDEICVYSDGILLGRGDLALNIDHKEVPLAQDLVVKSAKKLNTFCIIGTQFLENYAQKGQAYFPELNDIFLAINQDTNAIMLSGESGGSPKSKQCITLLKSIIDYETSKGRIEMMNYSKNCKTQILATMGPTLETTENVKEAIEIGVENFRIHLGLRNRDSCAYFKNIRCASEQLGKKVEILLDLPSSRMRIGKMDEKVINQGEQFKIIDVKEVSNDDVNLIPLKGLKSIIQFLKEGERILFRDGRIGFKIIKVDAEYIEVECLYAGITLRQLSSCFFPESQVKFEPIVEEDISILEKLKEAGCQPDWIALSFASDKYQIEKVRKLYKSIWNNDNVRAIAKIENKYGLENIEEIIESADGVMIARGDLLLAVEAYKLPRIQQELVNMCNRKKKVSVVATEMLENYAENGIVNRAELSDIALAVRQNASAVMMSRESGNSKFSRECMKLMKSIINSEIEYKSI